MGPYTTSQSEPGSHDNEGVLPIPKDSRTGASPSDAVKCHTLETSSV